MGVIVDLIYSILFIAGGYNLIRHRRVVKSWTGNFMWAENFFGRGATYGILILVGLGMIFLGVLYPFGGLELISGGSISGEGNSLNLLEK